MTDDYKLIIEQDYQTVMAHYAVAPHGEDSEHPCPTTAEAGLKKQKKTGENKRKPLSRSLWFYFVVFCFLLFLMFYRISCG